ncbi:MAG: ribbon-helix-helix protein, CopG family [Oscillospiraceae bacterium]|nr:ribbon-helix-helix protein, CopG family [Oscillospiraceae bacterium]
MSPRIGRPKIENPMNERVTVRLDKESAETLKRYCEKAKVEKAEAIRRAISKLKSELDKK